MKRSDLGKVIDLEELAVEFVVIAMTSTCCRGCRLMVQWALFGGRTGNPIHRLQQRSLLGPITLNSKHSLRTLSYLALLA